MRAKQRGILGILGIPGISSVGITGIVAAVAIAAIGGWGWLQKRNVERAELARDQAIAQRDQAAVERDKAIEAARINEQTIANLQQEKELINQALNDLQAQRVAIQANTVTREVIIQRQATTSASAAVTAPVIGDIIVAVQEDRVRRRGQ